MSLGGVVCDRWTVGSSGGDLQEDAGCVHPLVLQILRNRSITDPRETMDFLSQEPPQTNDAALLKDGEAAADRIIQGIDRRELIAVYGDFDVDGVTAVALLSEVLVALGGRVMPYVPPRSRQKDGPNLRSLDNLHALGVRLVVTVDTGCAAEREIAHGRALGLDIIVTDHHQISKGLPTGCLVVNPRQEGCKYPFKHLAGVGVAFKLAQLLLRRRVPLGVGPRTLERSLLDLVALGTIADQVPLVGDNRTLVRRGLQVLAQTRRPGLRQLMQLASVAGTGVIPSAVSLHIAPRLNSPGRVGHPMDSLLLLMTMQSEPDGVRLAQRLEELNCLRQKLTVEALARARDEIATMDHRLNCFVVAGQHYPAGIVSILACKLAEELNRPVFVLERGAGESRGSARSMRHLNVTALLAECDDLLCTYGGHAHAAGFTVPNENIDLLRQRLERAVDHEMVGQERAPVLCVDCELPLRDVDWALFAEIERLAPFGAGNPVPTFVSRGLRVLEKRMVGRDVPKHLRLRLHDGRKQWNAIGFNMAHTVDRVTTFVDVVYSLERSERFDTASLNVLVRDWRPHA